MECKLLHNEIIKIQTVKKNYENSKAAVIDSLKILQKRLGWVPDWGIYEISKLLNMSPEDVESIATFYSQIFRKPVARNLIRLCDSVVCYLNGYEILEKKINTLLNININCMTEDKKFTVLPVCCLGSCDKAPVIMVNSDIYYKVDKFSIINILDTYK
ncbi:NADH-quinone oxidoreductase subunit NuoE [Buchnera aphidicola (Thelaxes californica)]|uniref:NADH-quinone oxidoreductase subunit E n=1 Tax=Buchnera aphidicola (Thelaxes californica) TaxID=1315998 RepID=A0A4D6YA73_9GAMM|nr:NADH-quinone oxidoreductase subunit NuoE [Buchnera aphidicola]QCI26677.1 NADH-quinone oxidoreductase subunit NuoE [Buchnera aphidicola (Thelaxes californica)]